MLSEKAQYEYLEIPCKAHNDRVIKGAAIVRNIFLQHPKEVGESYLEHAKVALSFAFNFQRMAIMSFIHAFFPFLFIKSTSNLFRRMQKVVESRGHNSDQC